MVDPIITYGGSSMGDIVARRATGNHEGKRAGQVSKAIESELGIDKKMTATKERLGGSESKQINKLTVELAKIHKQLSKNPNQPDLVKRRDQIEKDVQVLQEQIKAKIAASQGEGGELFKLKREAAKRDTLLSYASKDLSTINPQLGGVVQSQIAATNKLSQNVETVTEQSLLAGGGSVQAKAQVGYQKIAHQLKLDAVPFLSNAA